MMLFVMCLLMMAFFYHKISVLNKTEEAVAKRVDADLMLYDDEEDMN